MPGFFMGILQFGWLAVNGLFLGNAFWLDLPDSTKCRPSTLGLVLYGHWLQRSLA